jgi:hypothetical protein
MVLKNPKAVDLIQAPPAFDDVMICGACGSISIITLQGTRLMTEEELLALSEEEQRDLTFAQRAIRRSVRNN